MLGFLVPNGGALGDDGSHDLGDGASQVGHRPVENGRGLGGDGGNDVVDQLEFLLHLDHLFLLLQMLAKPSTHLEHGLANFVHHFAVIGQGFLGFGRELHVGAREVNQNGSRALRDASSTRLIKAVLAPINRFDGFGQQATALLVHQRHTVGESEHFHRLVGCHAVTEDEADFDLVGVALRDGG